MLQRLPCGKLLRTSNRPNINAERSADLKAAPFILCLKKIPLGMPANAEQNIMPPCPTRPSRAIQ